MSLLVRIAEEQREDISIATVVGEIDASNAAEVSDRLRRLVTNRDVALIVDLTGTTYVDSAGINLLFELAAALEHRQQRLRLVVPSTAQIARMLAIAGLDGVAGVHPTRAAALDG